MKYVSLAVALLVCSIAIFAKPLPPMSQQPSAPYTEQPTIGKDERRMEISVFPDAIKNDDEILIEEEGDGEESDVEVA